MFSELNWLESRRPECRVTQCLTPRLCLATTKVSIWLVWRKMYLNFYLNRLITHHFYYFKVCANKNKDHFLGSRATCVFSMWGEWPTYCYSHYLLLFVFFFSFIKVGFHYCIILLDITDIFFNLLVLIFFLLFLFFSYFNWIIHSLQPVTSDGQCHCYYLLQMNCYGV